MCVSSTPPAYGPTSRHRSGCPGYRRWVASADRLTRREREIMNALFALGNRASAEEIRARLTNPPGDSSVRVMLARLEKKGCPVDAIDHPRVLAIDLRVIVTDHAPYAELGLDAQPRIAPG